MEAFRDFARGTACHLEAVVPGVVCEIVARDMATTEEVLLPPEIERFGRMPPAMRRFPIAWTSPHGELGGLRIHLPVDRWLSDNEMVLIDDVSTRLQRVALVVALEALRRLDDLTRLPNVVGFRALADKAMARCARDGASAIVGLLDADGLSRLNDRFDYTVGDDAIRHIARVLLLAQRKRNRGTVIGRYRGDEMLNLLPAADIKEACQFGTGINVEIRQLCLEFQGKPVQKIASSIGFASFPQHGRDFDTLRYRAALAKGLAKAMGGNRTCSYDEHLALDETSRERLIARMLARKARARRRSPAKALPKGP